MRLVLALGGNALLKKGEALEASVQLHNITVAAQGIAAIAGNHELVITHGNGPQVGLLALQAESYTQVKAYPLDMLDAESAGLLGYAIVQQLHNAMPHRQSVALITQVLVDQNDPAFKTPDKPIGPVYDTTNGAKLAGHLGWSMVKTDGGLRRTVPSPQPQKIIEKPEIELLTTQGRIVVCCGGGGIPVIREASGKVKGIAAVIDKDATSAMLAAELDADRLVLLTDIEAVFQHWGTDQAHPVTEATVAELQALRFEPGTMGPKVAAACRFVATTGKPAHIGHLNQLSDILNGHSGTLICAE